MNTNDVTIYAVWGALASRMLVAVSRRNDLPCSVFATDYIDLYRSIGLGRTRTKSAVNLQLARFHRLSQRFVSIGVHSWLQLIWSGSSSDSGRADQRNHLAFVPAVNAKIFVGCNHAVMRIKLAHPDQTKIRQIGLPVGITFGQVRQLRQMIVQIKRDLYQLADNHFEDDFNAPQFESRFREDGFAGERRFA